MLSLAMPEGLERLGALLDEVAERQRQDFGQLDSEAKADGSLITACDRWSDATLVKGLAELYPGEGVLSEEGSQRVPTSEAYWVVDPLDGTTNFAAGIPYWAISLARFENGVPVLAVLDVPPLRQRIVAIKGGGAWRKDKNWELRRPGTKWRAVRPSAAARSGCCRSFRISAFPARFVCWG